MNWRKIDRTARIQYAGVYNDWKSQISEDCYRQCVYCSISEGSWGGIDHYHIDHFRPKSLYPLLENIITNLYYSCPICNKFKSDDWQNDPVDLNLICYPDPSDHDYSTLFEINISNYQLVGKYKSANYLINRLYLNRPQLIYQRREFFLKIHATALIAETEKLLKKCEDVDLMRKANQSIVALTKHLLIRDNIRPYELNEIKRPKTKKSAK